MAKEAAVKETLVTYVPRVDGDPVSTMFQGLSFKANVPRSVSNPTLIKAAQANPWFLVGDQKPQELGGARKPTNDTEYRAYAVEWIQASETSAEMVARWDNEESLRTECGVGTDDLEFLSGFFMPRLENLKKAELEARNEGR